jgi:hypothetical protein
MATGSPVSEETRSANPRSSTPPPASRMPSRAMSPVSSGGVCSSVSLIAFMISVKGPAIAVLTSPLRSSTSVGRPVSRWRPRTSVTSSGDSGIAAPIPILIASAVCEPIASECSRRR